MKTTILLAALLSCATLSYAQTAPTPATGTTQPSGTKNVGSDRADVPQAPGMQAAVTTPTRSSGSKTSRRQKKAASSQSMAPKQ